VDGSSTGTLSVMDVGAEFRNGSHVSGISLEGHSGRCGADFGRKGIAFAISTARLGGLVKAILAS
jgi:hypothetical protein